MNHNATRMLIGLLAAVVLCAQADFAHAQQIRDPDDVERETKLAESSGPERWDISFAGGYSRYEDYLSDESGLWDNTIIGVGGMLRVARRVGDSTHVAGRWVGAKMACISHETGTCPGSAELALLYGISTGGKWGHVAIEGGLAVGYLNPDATPTERPTVLTAGLAAGAEAFFTPWKYFGIGLQAPTTLNQEVVGMSLMMALKIGQVRP